MWEEYCNMVGVVCYAFTLFWHRASEASQQAVSVVCRAPGCRTICPWRMSLTWADSCAFCILCSDPHLQFVEEVALPPPEVAIDLQEQERNERELQEAVNAPLPADDDDELID